MSGDGKLVASGGADQTVRLWDAATGRPRATLKGHTDKVRGVALSRDGKLLVSASEDDTVRLWDAVAGREKAVFKGHADEVTAVALSGDGRLAAAASDSTIQLWDTVTGREKAAFEGHTDKVTCVALSGDGKLLVSGSRGGTVRRWDLPSSDRRGAASAGISAAPRGWAGAGRLAACAACGSGWSACSAAASAKTSHQLPSPGTTTYPGAIVLRPPGDIMSFQRDSTRSTVPSCP
jgi:tricorn protease-like protein